MKINRTYEEPREKKDRVVIIVLAILAAGAFFIFIEFAISMGALLISLIILYWTWILGGIVGLFILKRIFFGRFGKKK